MTPGGYSVLHVEDVHLLVLHIRWQRFCSVQRRGRARVSVAVKVMMILDRAFASISRFSDFLFFFFLFLKRSRLCRILTAVL
jgi:hypothetical protein